MMTSMTPYAAHKIVNKALTEAGIDSQIPPQMMYNYTTSRVAKGKKSFIELDTDNKITEEGLAKWLQAYINKKLNVTVVEVTDLVDATDQQL